MKAGRTLLLGPLAVGLAACGASPAVRIERVPSSTTGYSRLALPHERSENDADLVKLVERKAARRVRRVTCHEGRSQRESRCVVVPARGASRLVVVIHNPTGQIEVQRRDTLGTSGAEITRATTNAAAK